MAKGNGSLLPQVLSFLQLCRRDHQIRGQSDSSELHMAWQQTPQQLAVVADGYKLSTV